MINEVEFLKNNGMEVIYVKDKHEVVEACELLKKIGIEVLKDYKSYHEYLAADTVVENNYLIREDGEDEGWRIQSHFISDDFGIPELRKAIENILSHPDFKQDMELEAILTDLHKVYSDTYMLISRISKLRKAQ